MSTTGRGDARRPLDAYYTPDALAAQLVSVLDIAPGSRVVEPSVGGGAFVRALRRVDGVHITGVDVDPAAPGLALCDVARVGDWMGATAYIDADWIVGNPPYSDAEQHIRAALWTAPHVAMLLRLAMLESVQRVPLWRDHPPAEVWVLSRRPSFTGNGTDSAAYGWFVWRHTVWRHTVRETRLRWLTPDGAL